MKENILVSINNLEIGYDKLKVVTGVSFEIKKNEIVALLGANGAGKSTILNAISGILHPEKGDIYFEDRDITNLSPDEIVKLGLVQVPEQRHLFSKMSIQENLEMGAFISRARIKKEETIQKVFKLFPILKERRKQIAETLSGGEQQMLAIARSLMVVPKLLMLDEPSLGLAPILLDILFETIVNINKEGVTILLVEQNVNRSLSIANYGYILENGKIALRDKSANLLNNIHVKEAYLSM